MASGSEVNTDTQSDTPKKAARPRVHLAQRRRARRLILQALYQWQIAKAEPLEIASQFHEANPGKIDWDYFNEVFPEIPGQASVLEAYLQPPLDLDVDALDPIERALLYLGTFKLDNRWDVHYRVVINESVELAKVFGATDSHKYINGVLDKLIATLRPAEFAASRNSAR